MMKNILDIINLRRTLLISLVITLLFCSFNSVYADYNDDVNVGNTSAQEVGDAIYRQTYYAFFGIPYNHAGVYYKLLGETHRIIHVNVGSWWNFVTCKHVVREDSFDNFKRSTVEYLGAYSSNLPLTAEQRENMISTLEQLRDKFPIYYTCWGQVDGAGVGSWEGTIDDIDNLRCDGLVEIVYEMNGIDVWGKNQDHYSIVDYPDEHNFVPYSVLDIGCGAGDTCPEPDPNIEVLPVVQRGGYDTEEDQYTKLRASVPEPPDIIIDSPLEGAKKTGLFKITALPEDESGILHVIFEYSTDHVNWYPLPGPDSETGKDVYEADGWGLRFDTVGAGIGDSQVWVRTNATDKAGNTSDWTEIYYFVNNVSIAVSITLDPSSPTTGSPVPVSGHAEYQDGQPVQNGSVGIITSSGTWTTTTDSYGDYSREITAPGESGYVYVTVSHDNYLGAAAEWLWISGGSHVSGTLTNDTTWTTGGSPYIVTGSISIPEGVTLTINPGVTVKFVNSGYYLYVSSSLVADGTSDEPIVFTSNQAEPDAGQWGGIRFNEGSSSVLDYCVVEYGGYSGYYAGIYTVNSSPVITNCTIRNNFYYGVRVAGTSEPTITGCTITGHTTGIYSSSSVSFSAKNCVISGNSSYGIHNAITTTSINAENCDWGHVSGPLDPSDDRATGGLYNPEEQGDKVSDHVDYYPWTTIEPIIRIQPTSLAINLDESWVVTEVAQQGGTQSPLFAGEVRSLDLADSRADLGEVVPDEVIVRFKPQIASSLHAVRLCSRPSMPSVMDPSIIASFGQSFPDEIISIRPSVSGRAKAYSAVVNIAEGKSLMMSTGPLEPKDEAFFSATVEDAYEEVGPIGMFYLELSPGTNVREICLTLMKRSDVVYAHPNPVSQPCAAPNDSLYDRMWNLERIGMPTTWDISGNSPSGVRVCVMDTGVRITHNELLGRTADAVDVYASNGDAYGDTDPDNDDENGHGTSCAGIIGAIRNNNEIIAGIAPVTIIPVNGYGLNADNEVRIYNYTEGVYWGVDHNADVISLSLGDYRTAAYQWELDAAAYAENHGVIVCAAAGNDDGDTDNHYPSAIPYYISVAAVDDDDLRVTEPKWSWGSNHGSTVDICAPGQGNVGASGDSILTLDRDSNSDWKNSFNGTSAATPHVAGLAAMILHLNPDLSATQVRSIIETTAEDQIGDVTEDVQGWDEFHGHGLINAAQAVAKARAGFVVYNDGNADLEITAMTKRDGDAWLDWVPTAPLTIAPGGSQVITVSIDWSQLPGSSDQEQIIVYSNDDDMSPYANAAFVNATKPLNDTDGDDLPDSLENTTCTDPNDADTDDDGISDGIEDVNHNGVVDPGETNPCSIDTDGDGIQDGTELGYTLADIVPDTNTGVFQPDLDPASKTDPLDVDSDEDSIPDGMEDANYNGRMDAGETDPSDPLSRPVAIHLKKGFNLIAIPSDVTNQSDLKDWLPVLGDSSEIEKVMVYDGQAGKFVTLIPGDPSNESFTLNGGEGIIVYAKQDKEITFTTVLCATLDLKQGFNLVGFACPKDNYTVFQLLSDLGSGNVSSIQRYSTEKGAFETAGFVPDGQLVGVDFTIVAGEGCFIYMK